MRIVGAVVVGLVLLSAAHGVHAAEAKRERSERCLEICNFDFEKCTKAEGSKGPGRCNIDVVRCKKACPLVVVEEPAVPTYKSQQRCIDGCQLTYKKCLADPKNKGGGNCAAEDMRCERACPAPPEAVAAPPGAPSADGTVPAPGSPAVKAPPRSKPKRAARVEGAAAPAPAPATPAPPAVERVVAPPPTVRSEAVAPAATAPGAEPAAAAARPEQTERGFFGTLGCFFVSCEPAGSSPCLQQCAATYDECHVRESKRGGECNTRLMHCRQACSSASPAQP